MKKIQFIAMLVILFFVVLAIFFKGFLTRVEVGGVGVRLQQYGFLGKKGVHPRDYGPGWHRNIPLLDTWKVYDATVQTTEFTSQEDRQRMARKWSSYFSREENARSTVPVTGPERIELKSRDGYTVRLDVTVKYRVMPGKAHLLHQDSGSEIQYKGIVRDQSQDTLRSVFGTMRTEEFYNPAIRSEKTAEAADILVKRLEDRYVELTSILIRDISFDPAYERKILDKKLADQDVELNKSRAIREEKRGETNKIDAETEANVAVIKQEQESELVKMKAETERQIAEIHAQAQLEVSRIRADADLYAAEQIAKGDLLERTADAAGEQLKAGALKGSGGANLVARQAAQNIQLGNMVLSTINTNFLDVESMVEKLGARSE